MFAVPLLLVGVLRALVQEVALVGQPVAVGRQLGRLNDPDLIRIRQALAFALQDRQAALKTFAFTLLPDIERRISMPLLIARVKRLGVNAKLCMLLGARESEASEDQDD